MKLISHSHTLNTLIRKVMIIIKLGMKLNLVRKVREKKIMITQQLLEREAWRLLLMSSQKYFPFKELDKYDMVEVHGIKCKLTTN